MKISMGPNNRYFTKLALALSLLLANCGENTYAGPAGTAHYSNEPGDGEYMILYDAKNHPVTLPQLIQILKQKTSYRCSISEWQGMSRNADIPIIRVETAMPIMIMDDHAKVVRKEMQDFARDKHLNPSEVKFINSCTARLQVSGAGNRALKRLPNGDLQVEEAEYAPHAKDTIEVVMALMKAVDGIATCNTDGSWIHK
jgi:hypothetical protein